MKIYIFRWKDGHTLRVPAFTITEACQVLNMQGIMGDWESYAIEIPK